jgi:type I restriction enzyme R subunit
MPELNTTALFDPNIDNGGGATPQFKEAGLVEIITDYNARYDQKFEFATHARLKRDIAARLAHKEPYRIIERTPEQQINILLVVDQMLTGFDSKWINTLYMDKLLEYQNIIQAFSRTNRLFGYEKPFGTIRYYRKPHTMAQNIEKAVKLYSGDKPIGLFVQRLKENLIRMNEIYAEIKKVFEDAGVADFTKTPEDKTACGKFAKLFREMNDRLEAAKIQGFKWDKAKYEFQDKPGTKKTVVAMEFDENTYLILALRYKEMFTGVIETKGGDDIPFDVDGYLIEIDTGKIDADYMNSRFDKYLKLMNLDPMPSKGLIDQALDNLHKTFATLTQEEQKYANIFLHDIQSGGVAVEEGKTLRDYITEYMVKAKDDQIRRLAKAFGLDEAVLRSMMNIKLTEVNINEYGRFDSLKKTVDKAKARAYFEKQGETVSLFRVNVLIDKLLKQFLLEGGFNVEEESEASGEPEEHPNVAYELEEPERMVADNKKNWH